MKKFIAFLIAFCVVWFAVAGFCLLIGDIFHIDFLQGRAHYVQIGFAGAVAGLFGAPLAARIEKLYKKWQS